MFSFSAANYSLKLHKTHSVKAAAHEIITMHYIIRYLSARELVLPPPPPPPLYSAVAFDIAAFCGFSFVRRHEARDQFFRALFQRSFSAGEDLGYDARSLDTGQQYSITHITNSNLR